jgi:glutamate formiminotransferase
VGARRVLIAFNINLDTDRVDIARQIARRVRESNGGLPHVKALGLALSEANRAQVSMNLTDYETTPIERVFDTVAAYARELRVGIAESELIGLIPAAAMAHTTADHLMLRNFSDARILENRLEAAGFTNS